MKPFYQSKKGRKIELEITKHARYRFRHRWSLLSGHWSYENIDETITAFFNESKRITNFNNRPELKKRLKRNGNDSLYFIDRYFTYIVQNKTIVTIEISGGSRNLNKVSL
jgi:hypothetical protein